ncbi:MAG TPA: glycosyltransferase [Roseiflexaceae bacterium]|nr:glycosyltransferase [Roseiflexaceae bacterium]
MELKTQNSTLSTPEGDAPAVSIIMPTYGHAAFILRAVASVQAQTLASWELLIIDDASPDRTGALLAPLLEDRRISYWRLERNRGLGAALNIGLEAARAPLVAYLPSDDLYHPEHLRSLADLLAARPDAVLAFSGVRHHYNRYAEGQIEGEPIQLVQTLHRRTPARWLERDELVTDDLERMGWARLREQGAFVGTGTVTCEWVDHPGQLHKLLREPLGGINPYRARFQVGQPLRFHSSLGNLIDEQARYQPLRERPTPPRAADGLKILLVGELAYNAERVLALEERGHRLYGLWTPEPYWFNAVGPLPFGQIEDLPRSSWREEVRRIKPDVIYALLNWQTVAFAHQILEENPGIPFVWHFKEGPFICLEKGLWRELVDLYTRADGQIYSSPEMRDWFDTVVPGLTDSGRSLVLDGDLPLRFWTEAPRSPRRSERDGQIHTVVPGRPIGLHPHTVGELAEQGIHLHFYGDFTQGVWRSWIAKVEDVARGFLHLHPNVDQDRWVEEFSQYDAGWLHVFESRNRGDLRRADWDDLNYPARIATLAVAGLPLLQRDNSGAVVAAQNLARRLDIGVFFRTMDELRARLADTAHTARLRENVWRQRDLFTFDHHADRLVDFFRSVIARKR